MLNGAGTDYPCDDSDGADKTVACQARTARLRRGRRAGAGGR